jgi:predicted enzyme related to lactoylglutathione lyase
MLHHIAIGTKNLEALFEFYNHIPGLIFLEWKYDDNMNKRSAWFSIRNSGLLMLEKKEIPKAPEALVFAYDVLYHEYITKIEIIEKTKYSIYFNDPDSNKLGFSSFPNPIIL